MTWLGLKYDEAWIWLIVMLGMPGTMVFGVRWISSKRPV
jgi:hypothetical protein